MKNAGRLMLLVSLLPVLILSCGIESFESLDPPNPPLSLSVYSVNREIILTFQAYNPEESFSGYNIYVGNDDTTVRAKTIVIPNPDTGTLPTVPYIWPYSDGMMHLVTITNSKNTNGLAYSTGPGFYIGVAAYDAFNKRVSLTSDVVILSNIID